MVLASPRLRVVDSLQKVATGLSLLQYNARGDGVVALQRALHDLGTPMPRSFSNGEFDGVFGQETRSGVQGFQAKRGLVADGIVGPKTLSVMDQFFNTLDPWFDDPLAREAAMHARMFGPPELAPFGTFTLRHS